MAETPTLFASGTTSQAVAASVTVLSAASVAGLFSFHIDTNAMQAGDVVELYLYRTVLSGGVSRGEALLDRIVGAAASVNSIGLAVRSYSGIGNDLNATNALQFALSQLDGTARAFPWKVLQY